MKLSPRTWIVNHFRYLATLSPFWFIVWTGLESVFVSFVTALLLMPFHVDKSGRFENLQFGDLLIDLVIVPPLLETLLLQTIPVRIAQFFTRRFDLLLLNGSVLFALIHFNNGLGSGLAAGVFGGFYVAFSYAVWVSHSHWKAFLITAAMHSLGNLCVALLLLF